MERPQGVFVRDATEADRPAIGEVTKAAYAEYAEVMAPSAWEGLRAAVERALAREDGAERIVAEAGGQIVGSVLLYPGGMDAYGGAVKPAPWPEVRLLAVSPSARGRGVGKVLMDECIRRARAAGATEIGVHTSASMAVAIEMYRRMGFRRQPDYDFQPPGAELVEAYSLALDGHERTGPTRDRPSLGEPRESSRR